MKKTTSFEESWKIEMRRGILQYAVLAIVKKHKEGVHGYKIAKDLEERTRGLLKIKEGTLYPILHRLQKERLLDVSRMEKSEAGPKRKVYVLTSKGDRVLRALAAILREYLTRLEEL